MVKKLITLMAILAAALVAAVPALAQESPSRGSGTVPIVFQLTIHGQVPDGENFYLFTNLNGEAPAGFFCTTMSSGVGPRCEDGGTYTATIPVSTSDPFSYSYAVAPQSGSIEHFEAHTKVFTPGEIVTASYTVPSNDGPQGDPPSDPQSAPTSDLASSAPSSVAPVQPVSHTTPATDQYSSGSTASSASTSPASGNGSGISGLLPNTGGAMPLLILGAGLLAGGGILLRRFVH